MADPKKALDYAEQVLGVHSVYEEAKAARVELQSALDSLTGARMRKREYESALADREFELVTEERGKHPDMSVSGMEAHMRRIKNEDDACRELREQLMMVSAQIDAYETSKALAEADIKITASRLQELGGYLEFLAVIKRQESP